MIFAELNSIDLCKNEGKKDTFTSQSLKKTPPEAVHSENIETLMVQITSDTCIVTGIIYQQMWYLCQ